MPSRDERQPLLPTALKPRPQSGRTHSCVIDVFTNVVSILPAVLAIVLFVGTLHALTREPPEMHREARAASWIRPAAGKMILEWLLFTVFCLWLLWPLLLPVLTWMSGFVPWLRAPLAPQASTAAVRSHSHVERPGLPGAPSSQRFADQVAQEEAFETWFDLLPSTSEPFICEVGPTARPPLSYQRLLQFAASQEMQLGRFGIKRGDRVGSAVENGPEAAVCFMVFPLRCTFAPLNPELSEAELAFELEDLPCHTLLVMEGAVSPTVQRAAGTHNVQLLEMRRDLEAAGLFTLHLHEESKVWWPSLQGDHWQGRSDQALVMHTSGTTRKPKIVPLTHENLVVGALCIRSTLQLGPQDICLNMMPLYHIHGLAVNLLATGLAGGSVLCAPGLRPGAGAWLEHATWLSAVPTLYLGLLALTDDSASEQPFLKSPGTAGLRFLRSCSAALAPVLAERMENRFGCVALPTYAMTESMPIASSPLPPHRRNLRSVGLPAGPQLQIVREDDEAAVTLGSEGEICVKGCCVTKGYELRAHMDQDPNLEAFTREGWLRTGDKGFLDGRGHLCLTGRFKEIINRGGEKISPLEVENALRAHPGVLDCLVFAAPHAQLGEVAGLAMVASPSRPAPTPSTLEDLRVFGKAAGLGERWLPEVLVFIAEVPKGTTGKPARIGFAQRLGLPSLDVTSSKSKEKTIWDARSGVAVCISGFGGKGEGAYAALATKLAEGSVVEVISDEETRSEGWSSLELMRLSAEMKEAKFTQSVAADKLATAGVIGHIWFMAMLLICLEWLVAWCEPNWFGAVGSLASGPTFRDRKWPVMDRLRALSHLCGDAFFMTLAGLQDAEATREAGGGAKLFRRGLLFFGLFLVAMLSSRVLLRGPYLQLGWTTMFYAQEETNPTGILYQGMFIGVRALFAWTSGFVAWLSPGGGRMLRLLFVEYPVGPLICGLIFPALVILLVPHRQLGPYVEVSSTNTTWFVDGLAFFEKQARYIRELSLPYYFGSIFVGGLLFPRWRLRLMAGLPTLASALVGLSALLALWMFPACLATSSDKAQELTGEHGAWNAVLAKHMPQVHSDFPSFWHQFLNDHDVFQALASAVCLCLASLAAPAQPTILSRLGSQIATVYLTLPLVMIPLMNFLMPGIMALQNVPWAFPQVTQPLCLVGCCALTIIVAARPLPTWMISWAERGTWAEK